ncbi:uncharacterized protein HD556DRAFT_643282 [Suillus plorans]|uniref:Uncharacterized protein n=1 Tax=Suillus plorans TaxID=116603 RepID=A0A9P7AMI0_9AGAM|nr:uncharacterized protein HD556DRAFT_643282 [Suillus plorans]KAG1791553.1 hypothetical protein HD556DRAFT_643282 [Suillus plorans]
MDWRVLRFLICISTLSKSRSGDIIEIRSTPGLLIPPHTMLFLFLFSERLRSCGHCLKPDAVIGTFLRVYFARVWSRSSRSIFLVPHCHTASGRISLRCPSIHNTCIQVPQPKHLVIYRENLRLRLRRSHDLQ